MARHAPPEEYQMHPIETLRTNSLDNANIAELARKKGVTLLFTSTSEIYSDAQVVSIPETYWGTVNPIGHMSCHFKGKQVAEVLFMAYHTQYGLDLKIARIFNSFGSRLKED